MSKLYFVCMGNYYRSRLAEELAYHYADQHGVAISADSGGLGSIPNPNHPGTIARGTLQYLRDKNISPRNAGRFPKSCAAAEIYAADIVICTDEEEQRELFEHKFPDFKGQLICWNARDIQYDAMSTTLEKIDAHVQDLIRKLTNEN